MSDNIYSQPAERVALFFQCWGRFWMLSGVLIEYAKEMKLEMKVQNIKTILLLRLDTVTATINYIFIIMFYLADESSCLDPQLAMDLQSLPCSLLSLFLIHSQCCHGFVFLLQETVFKEERALKLVCTICSESNSNQTNWVSVFVSMTIKHFSQLVNIIQIIFTRLHNWAPSGCVNKHLVANMKTLRFDDKMCHGCIWIHIYI